MVGPSIRPMIVISLFFAVALAGCAGGGFAGEVGTPSWKPGYTWAYDVAYEGEYEYYDSEDGESESDTYEESYREIIKVLNTTMVIDDKPLYIIGKNYVDGTDDPWSWVGAIEKRDLSFEPLNVDLDYDCSTGICQVSVEGFDLYDWDDNNTHPDYIQFPLQGGKSWDGVYGEDMDDDFPPVRITRTVVGGSAVETPQGIIQVIEIDETARLENVNEWKQTVRTWAAEEGIEVTRLDVSLDHKSKIYYSPEFMNVVHEISESEYLFDVAYEYEGESLEFRETSKGTDSRTLAGVSLVEEPEYDFEALGQFISDDTIIADPSANPVPGSIAWEIVSHVDRINAANDESASFEAVVDGDLGNMTIQWKLLSVYGQLVDTGSGTLFDPAPDTVGTFVVVADLVDDNGTYLARRTTTMAADYIYDEAMDCDPASAFSFPGCTNLYLPVRAGIRGLEIKGTYNNDLPMEGTLYLYDQWGQTTAFATSQNNEVSIELDTDDLMFAWDEDWRLRWSTTASVNEAMSFEIGMFADEEQSLTEEVQMEDSRFSIGSKSGYGQPKSLGEIFL